MKNPKNILIYGENIYLKKLNERDATQEYCNWLNDPEVTEHLVTVKTTIDELKKYINEKNNKKNCIFLGIFYRTSNKHIGNIKIELIDFERKKGMLGIIIGNKSYWRKGLATEAIRLFTNWIFEDLGLEKIEAGAFPENIASIKTFQKAGFTKDRIEPKSVMHKGKMSDNIIMSIRRN